MQASRWILGSCVFALVACADEPPEVSNDASSGDPTGTTTSNDTTAADDAPATGSSDGGPSSATDSGSTTDAATDTSGDSGMVDDSSSGEPPMGQPVTIAVGYGGMRVRSLDDGQTWQDYVQLAPDGGDDMDLLRGAAWGADRFVAVGWRVFSSPDGAEWTEHDNPTGQWYGAVAFGNDQFLAVGGGGYCARSGDGMRWEACTDATDGEGFVHVRSTLFLDGLFYTADANGVLRSSPDGDAWMVEDMGFGTAWAAIEDGMIVPADQSAPAEFATKRLRGGSTIQRAEPGSERWTDVFDVPDDNNVFQAHRFAYAEGWAP